MYGALGVRPCMCVMRDDSLLAQRERYRSDDLKVMRQSASSKGHHSERCPPSQMERASQRFSRFAAKILPSARFEVFFSERRELGLYQTSTSFHFFRLMSFIIPGKLAILGGLPFSDRSHHARW